MTSPVLNSDNRFSFNMSLNGGFSRAVIYEPNNIEYYKITNSNYQILE
jgi:hypothetical protein